MKLDQLFLIIGQCEDKILKSLTFSPLLAWLKEAAHGFLRLPHEPSCDRRLIWWPRALVIGLHAHPLDTLKMPTEASSYSNFFRCWKMIWSHFQFKQLIMPIGRQRECLQSDWMENRRWRWNENRPLARQRGELPQSGVNFSDDLVDAPSHTLPNVYTAAHPSAFTTHI